MKRRSAPCPSRWVVTSTPPSGAPAIAVEVSSPPTGTVTRPNDASRAPVDVSRSTSTDVGDEVNVAAFTIPTLPLGELGDAADVTETGGDGRSDPRRPTKLTGAPVEADERCT